MAVLVVEETPVPSQQDIHNGHGAVKGELGNLGGGELAVGVAELDNGGVITGREGIGDDTIVSGFLDGEVDRVGVREVDSLGNDTALGLLGGIGRYDELANVLLVAFSFLDVLVGTDS